jgi:hypothetical protein
MQLLEKLARWGLVKEPPAFWVCISLVTRIFIAEGLVELQIDNLVDRPSLVQWSS